LTGLTKLILETVLEEELSDRVGHDKRDPVGCNGTARATTPARRR